MVGAVDAVFLRMDGVEVRYQISLTDIYNRNENFTILKSSGIDSPIERRLFYHFDKRNWTLNEFIYFAENNELCIFINDPNKDLSTHYGACALYTGDRLFELTFNKLFN